MQAVEIQTTIVDHRIDLRSELLPAYATQVKVIVLYEEASVSDEPLDIVALARAARAAFPRQAADWDGTDAVAQVREARQGVSLDGLNSQDLIRDGRC